VDASVNDVGEWPLVLRDVELAEARSALRTGRGAVLVGEAGTGKTRLGSAIVTADASSDIRWHVVIGSKGATRVPLGAFFHLLPETWEPGADDLATWRSLGRSLGADGGEIHLFVDDAQWLDPVSAGLVHHLVTSGGAKALLTVRRHEHVGQPITALWKDRHLVRQDLEPLDASEVATALEAALGAPVEPRTTKRLHERSTGNFLMLRELVDAGLADRSLQLRHGAWVQEPNVSTSTRIVDLLADRIADLSPSERAAAELVAVAEPISAEVLCQAIAPELLRRCVSRRVIEIDRTGGHEVVRSAHPLLAEVLNDRMDRSRHDEVVRTIVDLIEGATSVPDAELVRTAVWRLEIGLPLDGPEALRAAGLAFNRNDVGLAEELARVAIAAGAGPEATIRLGEALQRQQRSADAEAVLAPLADRLDELEPPLRLRYAEGRALALSTNLGRLDDAAAVLEETLTTMPDGKHRWALEARLAFVLSDCGRLRAAAPLAEARMAAIAEDERSALGAFTAHATVLSFSGRGKDALVACETMLPVALNHLDDVPVALGWIVAQRMLAHHLLGEIDEWREVSAFVETTVLDDSDSTQRAALLTVQGLLAAEEGDLDHSAKLLQQSAALHEIDNHRGYQSWAFATLARVQVQRGELEDAQRSLADARRTLWPAGQVFDVDLDAAALWIAVTAGKTAEAEQMLSAAIDRADAEGRTVSSASLRHEAIRAGLPVAPHLAPLATFAEVDQGRRGSIWHAHAEALASDDGGALIAVGHRFVELGTRLVAAEAFMQASNASVRAGLPARAAQARELGRQQLARCPGARTQALVIGSDVAQLTKRELDVAQRVARGDSNRAIADALGISVRTIETHVQRAFAKFGVRRRHDLAALLNVDEPDR
jgi:DNA-binding CsgD family transcriptional regulator